MRLLTLAWLTIQLLAYSQAFVFVFLASITIALAPPFLLARYLYSLVNDPGARGRWPRGDP